MNYKLQCYFQDIISITIYLEVAINGSKEDIWCCNCSKCLFVYIILSPFLNEKELINIFGENLLNKKSLYETFMKLIGRTESKPFDCVGTYEEINYSVCKAIHIYINKNEQLPFLLKKYVEEILQNDEKKAEKIFMVYEEELLKSFEVSNINEQFENILKKALKRRKNGTVN